LTIKQVKKEIVAWETDMGREAKTVEVASIGQKSDDRPYDVGGHTCEQFRATVKVDGKTIVRCYEWDRDDEGISLGKTIVRCYEWDRDDEEISLGLNEEDEKDLP